ncbi:WBC30 [Symbiodinium sp. CCMP2592]|nr:WBC30 [Symbiodinium sp. CCMP2592]
MEAAQAWELCVLLLVAAGYVAIGVNSFLNRIGRKQQSRRSEILAECERCSVELVHSVVPDATVPDYRFRGMHLKMSSIHIGFDNVGVKLKSNGRCILEGVTGEFQPKRVAAIMGPSGAGKTTFMNALCGEQIFYSAKLRNPEGTAPEVLDSIVEDVLNVMQLLDVQHSLVGNVETRGISGGQRKRVNIGLELAARPTILMLDEPTSGLDATTALDIVRSLQKLTEIGMTVVMVVHQPRYSLFTLFHEVLLLGLGGQTVYLGPSTGALPYFKSLGFPIPQHENPADWFMDVISGKVRNEGAPSPSRKQPELATHWKESAKQGPERSMGHRHATNPDDKFKFHNAVDSKLELLGLGDVRAISGEHFSQILQSAGISPSEPALAEMKKRIGFEDDSVSRRGLARFLLGLRSSFSNDALSDVPDWEKDMEASEASMVSGASSLATVDKKMVGKRAHFWPQYRVLLHQNAIRWVRLWQQKTLSTLLVIAAAIMFGAQCTDKLVPGNILCPLKINLSHLAVGLMVGIACLQIFGADRPTFWRESASGIRVIAFFLARISVSLFDVLLWTYIYTAVWMACASAPCPYWIWLIAFRMTAVSSAGIGLLLSAVVPEHSSTLATAVTILIMGGGISEPETVAEAAGTFKEVLAFLSPFTWAIGENYLAVINLQGGEEAVIDFAIDIVEGYKNIILSLGGEYLGYVTAAYISCGVFGMLALVSGYLTLRFSYRGKQA